jgi:AcrR family transcriptional regulator
MPNHHTQQLQFAPALWHLSAMTEAAAKTAEPRSRLSAADWEQGALDLVAEQGVAAVAVEPLARRLGVTKGSFYWHFPTREALLKAALERWEKRDEEEVIGQVEPIADPRERLRALILRIAGEMQSHVIYSALLRAIDHPVVQPVMARVSQKRIDFLTVACRQCGLPRRKAEHHGRLLYSAYAGFLQMNMQMGMPRLTHEEFDDYVAHAIDTLVPK